MSYPYQIKNFEGYQEAYQKSIQDPEGFWSAVAEHFTWKKKWDKVLEWNFTEPKVEWFKGGKLNITENCLDRHIAQSGDKPAIIWEPNDPKERFVFHYFLQYPTENKLVVQRGRFTGWNKEEIKFLLSRMKGNK